MDSINQNQPEKNFKNLQSTEAIEKMQKLAGDGEVCYFCTKINEGAPFSIRPMAVLEVDDQGDLWFMSSKDSDKNQEIKKDAEVQLLFKGSDYADFMHIYGTASITEDKERIKELWNPMLKTWFTEGIDDPRISVLKVEPVGGYYWDIKHNKAIALIKRTVGAVTGKTLDDSIEGNLNV